MTLARIAIVSWVCIALGGTAYGAAQSGGSGGAAPASLANKLVNDRSADTFPNITQSEITAAVFEKQVVVAYSDDGALTPDCFLTTVEGCTDVGYARSNDGGVTWTDMGTPPVPSGDVIALVQEPSVVADRPRHASEHGVFYLGAVAVDASVRTMIGIYKSVDGAATWSPAVAAGLPAVAGEGQDSPWLAVDTRAGGSGAGNVYACWDRLDASGNRFIEFSRSTDGGATFDQLAGGITSVPAVVTGCRVAVNPLNGEVYVTWIDFLSGATPANHFRRSLDGGLSFGLDVTVAEFGIAATLSSECTDFGSLTPVFVDGEPGADGRGIRTFILPSMAVNPVNGHVYIVREQPDLPGGDGADIGISVSKDGGETWSTAARVNQIVVGEQFFPAIAVNSSGEIRVLYSSTQNSATNRLLDVYQVVSKDGATWSAPARVSAVSFDRPPTNPDYLGGRFCYMGDHNHIIAAAPGLGDKNFYLTWGDNRRDGDPNTAGVQPDPDVRLAVVRPTAVGGVCGYTVTSSMGSRCPLRTGDTVCRSVSAVTGACDAPLTCYGGGSFFCYSTLVPKSGPQSQCPFGSKRSTGLNCVAR